MHEKPTKPVFSPALDALGPVLVTPTMNHENLMVIADDNRAFGGDAYARIAWRPLAGRKTFVTILKFARHTVMLGEVGDDILSAIRPVAWRLKLPNRAIKCPARIDTDPNSPTYLHVWLNPAPGTSPRSRFPRWDA